MREVIAWRHLRKSRAPSSALEMASGRAARPGARSARPPGATRQAFESIPPASGAENPLAPIRDRRDVDCSEARRRVAGQPEVAAFGVQAPMTPCGNAPFRHSSRVSTDPVVCVHAGSARSSRSLRARPAVTSAETGCASVSRTPLHGGFTAAFPPLARPPACLVSLQERNSRLEIV